MTYYEVTVSNKRSQFLGFRLVTLIDESVLPRSLEKLGISGEGLHCIHSWFVNGTRKSLKDNGAVNISEFQH